MSTTVTLTRRESLLRPSSLPLPTTIVKSSPAERYNARIANGTATNKPISTTEYRAKLISVSSTGSAVNTPSDPENGENGTPSPALRRHAKSLTPDPNHSNNSNNKFVRKVNSSLALTPTEEKINRRNSVKKNLKRSESSVVQRKSSKDGKTSSRDNSVNGLVIKEPLIVGRRESKIGTPNKVSTTSSSATTSSSRVIKKNVKCQTTVSGTSPPPAVQPQNSQSAKSSNQPDIVKDGLLTSTEAEDKVREEKRQLSETLAQLSDTLKAKESEASEYKNAAQHNAKGFSALALSLDFVANKIGGLDAPKLRRQIEQLQKQLDKKEEDLARKVFHDTRIQDLTNQDLKHEREVVQLEAEFKAKLEAERNEWQQRLLSEAQAKAAEEVKAVEERWNSDSGKWGEERKGLEERIASLKQELKEAQNASRSKGKVKDSTIRQQSEKLEQIDAEIESLKIVLEMRNGENRNLRKENAKLELKVEEFDRIKLELQKANATLEDLKAQVDQKTTLERKLSAENHRLHQEIEREQGEKSQLSLEKEQLEYRIKQNNSTFGGSTCSIAEGCPQSANSSFNVSAAKIMSQSFTAASASEASAFFSQSLPVSDKREPRCVSDAAHKQNQQHQHSQLGQSKSSHQCCCHGVLDSDIRRPGSGLRRQASTPSEDSLPPPCHAVPPLFGDLGLHGGIGPGSQRVKEVISKSDSLSWKLEYDDDAVENQRNSPDEHSQNRHDGRDSSLAGVGVDAASVEVIHSTPKPNNSSNNTTPQMPKRKVTPMVSPPSCNISKDPPSTPARRKILPDFETLAEESAESSGESGNNSKNNDGRSVSGCGSHEDADSAIDAEVASSNFESLSVSEKEC